MERTIKVRTFLGQAIDTFKEYIKTKGNLQIDYSLEEYMQEILDYIDYLEKENQDLKKKYENAVADYETTMFEKEQLKKQLEEVEFIVGLRQKRNLIHKFDKEYDEEDKKKKPNRDYAGIMPDAEEVYRRYYGMKTQQQEFIKFLEDGIKSSSTLDTINKQTAMYIYSTTLRRYKEITGDDK